MKFDLAKIDTKLIYRFLTSIVIPRPIAWVSTISEDGINNLAPFSYFNMVGDDPPHVMFSTRRDNNSNKDTLNNVLATNQFVVNMVTKDLAEPMNASAEVVGPEVDEFALVGVTPIQSVKVKPMRVAESPIQLECELVHHYFLEDHTQGGACVLIGRVVMIHIDDEILLDESRINPELYKPIARLGGSNYSEQGEIFSIKRK
ncbi:MAG: flavin reductase family protein [Flavobacterium sp.]|nr:flavin reductase family protein [Flavobacterium sp.]